MKFKRPWFLIRKNRQGFKIRKIELKRNNKKNKVMV